MATNEYYNTHPQRPSPHSYNSYGSESIEPSPPYSSNAYSSPAYLTQIRPADPSPVSPFESGDDHVYPARHHDRDSQYSFGEDTTYYSQGGGGRPQHDAASFRDDIPLRDHRKPSATPETDHIYDAAEPARPPNFNAGRTSPQPKKGFGLFKSRGKIPWVVCALTIIQISVFIAEIVKNAQLTGSPIMIQPYFNPMIGPSTEVLINMGARYVPCMHNVTGVQDRNPPTRNWPCPNTTTLDANSSACTLSALCGFDGVPNPGEPNNGAEPNQWFRFILPIFLHAGIVHIGFNMLLQVTLGREIENAIGGFRFFIVYISSGIFGFVMGGNFAATGIASTGASGSLFGIIALILLDLLYTWKERKRPWMDLTWIGLDVVISFVLGLLPGLDNFSHIGGFLMGLVLGVCILRSPAALRRRINEDEPPYRPMQSTFSDDGKNPSGVLPFFKAPIGFFKGRKPLWWAWWLIRALALTTVLIVFIVLLNNFYIYRKTCGWCKYLSCLPINNWCELGNLQITTVNNKRSAFDSLEQMGKLFQR